MCVCVCESVREREQTPTNRDTNSVHLQYVYHCNRGPHLTALVCTQLVCLETIMNQDETRMA